MRGSEERGREGCGEAARLLEERRAREARSLPRRMLEVETVSVQLSR